MKKFLTSVIAIIVMIFSGASTWNYSKEKPEGPENWGELSEKFKFCKVGYNQSPIDIKQPFTDQEEIELSYVESDMVKEPKTFNMELDFYGKNFLWRGKKKYRLLYADFHHPSEHLVKGSPYSLEMQLTHKSEDEQFLILSVFFELGEPINQEVGGLINFLTSRKKEMKFDLSKIVKKDKMFFYEGSFTIPPCKEGVKWYVVETPLLLNKEQMQKLIKATIFVKSNARPVQEFKPEDF